MADYADLLQACLALRQRGFSLITIDGPGGAGKSTLARRLLADLECGTIVRFDDFYRPMPESERERLGPVDTYERAFDWERLRDEVLVPLRAGQPARYRSYDWKRGVLGDEEIDVQANGVLIVEGVYTLRPQLLPFWDLTVFLDVPRELRLARMVARAEHTPAQIERWMGAEDYYIQTVVPHQRADIVISKGQLRRRKRCSELR